MSKTIYLPKWTELVVAIYNSQPQHCYCERLYRKTGMTTRHLRNLVTDLEEMEIVRREQGRKIRYISLTAQGEQLAQLLCQIYPTLKR